MLSSPVSVTGVGLYYVVLASSRGGQGDNVRSRVGGLSCRSALTLSALKQLLTLLLLLEKQSGHCLMRRALEVAQPCVGPGASDLTSQCVSFFLGKAGTLALPTTCCCEDEMR